MEFFERAHVVKKKPKMKSSIAGESVKKQLKQMLHGYKENDNKIIKDAEDVDFANLAANDSDSVSGFSDLNLTNSSDDGDHQDIHSVSDVDKMDLTVIQASTSANKDETKNKQTIETAESISEYEDDIQSLPEEIPAVSDVNESDSDHELDSDAHTNTTANDSDDQFDPDGELACKILQKIKAKQETTPKKRKLDESETDDTSADDAEFANSIMRQTRDLNRKFQKEYRDNNQSQPTLEDYQTEDSDRTNIDSVDVDILETSTQDSTSTSTSAPFITVLATDMPDESLSDILGDYKHSTIKNISCEKQNVLHASQKSELFSSEGVDTATIMTEEETDSLQPELGDEVLDLEEDVSVTSEIILDDTIINDESDTNNENIEIDDSSQVITITDEQTIDSTEQEIINPVRRVFYGKNTCIFVLKHPTKIYIHGKVKAKALGGTIEIFGYTLQDKFSEIYAPNYKFAQCIKTVECQNVYYGLFNKLTSSGLSVEDAEEIVTTIGDYDGILSLSSLSNRKMDFVEQNFTAADLFTKPSKYIENCFKKASEMLGCSLYLTQPGRCFVENNIWEQAISCGLDAGSKAIICGGKSTGKSTFLRYYINKLVANGPILLIDLDPGQAELTVAGNVSATLVNKPLIGPNFTHLTKPDKMLNIGMISTMDNPTRYASAVINILEYCHANENYKKIPWVVNTMGMCNNLGLKFLTLTIQLVQPTVLVKMDSTNQKKRFEIDLHPSSVQQFFNVNKYDRLFKNIPHAERIDYTLITSSPLEINTKMETSLSAKEERYLNFLAYFGELLETHSGPGILGIVPYEVKLGDLNIGSNVNIRRDAVTKVINGKIIALCQLTTPDKGRLFNLRDNAVLCLGHGLVRGVDFDKGLLYIITPAPVDTLVHVDTLLYSDWVPDLKGQDKQVPDGTTIPYRTTSKQRQLMITPHRRFNPLQLLKMTRKS